MVKEKNELSFEMRKMWQNMTRPLIKCTRGHINTKAQVEEADTRGADFKNVSVQVRSP